MFPATRYLTNINTHYHATGYDDVSLQNPSNTDAHCSQQEAETRVLLGLLQFAQQCPTTLDCLWFRDEAHLHLDGFVNKQNMKFWASENAVVETSLHPAKCTVWCAISKQGETGPIFVEGTIISQQYLQQLQNEVIPVIQGAGHVDTTFFQQDGAHPHTVNVVLDALHDVFDSRVLLN
jgi:hypothetical protein